MRASAGGSPRRRRRRPPSKEANNRAKVARAAARLFARDSSWEVCFLNTAAPGQPGASSTGQAGRERAGWAGGASRPERWLGTAVGYTRAGPRRGRQWVTAQPLPSFGIYALQSLNSIGCGESFKLCINFTLSVFSKIQNDSSAQLVHTLGALHVGRLSKPTPAWPLTQSLSTLRSLQVCYGPYWVVSGPNGPDPALSQIGSLDSDADSNPRDTLAANRRTTITSPGHVPPAWPQ